MPFLLLPLPLPDLRDPYFALAYNKTLESGKNGSSLRGVSFWQVCC